MTPFPTPLTETECVEKQIELDLITFRHTRTPDPKIILKDLAKLPYLTTRCIYYLTLLTIQGEHIKDDRNNQINHIKP